MYIVRPVIRPQARSCPRSTCWATMTGTTRCLGRTDATGACQTEIRPCCSSNILRTRTTSGWQRTRLEDKPIKKSNCLSLCLPLECSYMFQMEWLKYSIKTARQNIDKNTLLLIKCQTNITKKLRKSNYFELFPQFHLKTVQSPLSTCINTCSGYPQPKETR